MSIPFTGRNVLLDIEGTAGSLSYVRETLFPYAQTHLADFLERRWDAPEVAAAREQMARDAGAVSFEGWLTLPKDKLLPKSEPTSADARARFVRAVVQLMRADAKQPGLKELQGLIWEEGYRTGALRSHLYPDVLPALLRWTQHGLGVAIYSSGSIRAQRLYFAQTEEGDLLRFFSAFFDTTTGPKREPESYVKIAAALRLPASEILFISDVAAELAAAQAAGFAVALAVRPGNPAPPLEAERFPWLTSFSEILPIKRAAFHEAEVRTRIPASI